MARFGTDKPDLRMGLELVECTDFFKDTPFRVFQSPYVGAVVMPGGSRPAAQAARRLAGVGQAAWRPRARLPAGQGGRRAHRSGRQEHQRRGAGRHRRPRRRRARRLHLLRGWSRQEQPGACWVPLASRSVAARPDRRGRLELRLGRRRTAVRAGGRGNSRRRRRGRRRTVDGRAPRLHQPQGPRHLRPGPRQRAGLGLRHRLQRQRDRWWLHPDPSAATSRSASSR